MQVEQQEPVNDRCLNCTTVTPEVNVKIPQFKSETRAVVANQKSIPSNESDSCTEMTRQFISDLEKPVLNLSQRLIKANEILVDKHQRYFEIIKISLMVIMVFEVLGSITAVSPWR